MSSNKQRYMTVKIFYGPGEPYTNTRELLEHLEDIGGITFSHDDVFKQRDTLRELVKVLQKEIVKLTKEV